MASISQHLSWSRDEVVTGDPGSQWETYGQAPTVWYKRSDDTPSALPSVSVELIDYLLTLYSFQDYITVSRYLFLYPELGAFLLEASAQIERLTGILYPILEVISDPDSGTEKLYILLPTKLPVQEALQIIRHFDELWWLDACERVGNILNIDLTYV